MYESVVDSQPIWYACQFCSKSVTTQNENEETYEDGIKFKILEASLKFVPDVGWSKEAIAKGSEKVGYPGITHGMFASGAADLVHYFQTSSNLKLVEFLKKVCSYF